MKRRDFIKYAGIGLGTVSVPFQQKKSEFFTHDTLIKPAKLKQGDTIALTAPAGIVYDESEFNRIQEELESMGLQVVFGEFVKERYGYFSGNDHQRALDLNRFFANPEVDAIMALRGGWGCSRILPHLDFEMIRKHPKIYCGFSDNTTLHLALRKYAGLISFHGPNGTSKWTELTRNSFRHVLMEGLLAEFKSNSSVETLTGGTAEGPIIGGNLTILMTSIGTPYQPDLTGSILFIEDIGESVYKVDRMLTHLKAAGILDQINGLIFGRCTDCEEDSGNNSFTMMEVLQHHIQPLNIPAIFGADIGHEDDNFTIPVGIQGRLNAGSRTFELLERAVT